MAHTKSPDYARLDDIDVYIQSIPRSPEEEKRLHDLLRKEMAKSRARNTALTPSKRGKANTKTPDYARLDDIDVYIQSTPISAEEEKQFSEVLKAYRAKHAVPKPLHQVPKMHKRSKATSH